MGEYIRNIKTGEEIKIGVLDRCFFSHKQVEDWHNDPNWVGWYGGKEEKGTLENYLKDPNSLYEMIDGLHHKEFAFKFQSPDSEIIDHCNIHVWKKGRRGNGYQYKVGCQFEQQKEVWAVIVGERYNEKGEARTIFACDCCEVLFSLPQDTIDKSLNDIDKSSREYFQEILKGRK